MEEPKVHRSPNLSKKHHYIPEAYIKGFANDNAFVFIYDKITDKIDKRKRSAASVCYTEHDNNITYKSQQYSYLEEIYHKLEEFSKGAFQEFGTNLTKKDSYSGASLSKLLLFINQIFWRSPANNEQTKKIINKYRQDHSDWQTFIEDVTTFRNFTEEDRLKLIKLSLPSEILLRNEDKMKYSYKYVAVQNSGPFLLTDNPAIYPKPPENAEDFTQNIIFPINKHRIYISTTKKQQKQIGLAELMLINVQAINQAQRFVICDDYQDLHLFVDSYRMSKNSDINFSKLLFDSIT